MYPASARSLCWRDLPIAQIKSVQGLDGVGVLAQTSTLMPSFAQDLPQELLGEIFIRCLYKTFVQPNSMSPPLVLCRVCRSWRRAALGTPHLWTTLDMKLERVPVRQYGGSFLHSSFNTLQFWGSHMGVLLPSLHFRHFKTGRPMSLEEIRMSVPFKAFFRSPVILNAQSFTFDRFPDFGPLNICNISFNNLEYLSIRQISGSESFILPFKFPASNLRRLHISYHDENWVRPSSIVTAFSWVTLTHLSAHLKIRRQDWYAMLAQCANMTSCSVFLCFQRETLPDGPAVFHNNLRTLSVRGDTESFTGVFKHFVFPSLVALRLSCTSPETTLKDVHQAITATPALKEFHLHFFKPFEFTDFLRQPRSSILAGPLCKFVPGLEILVFDRITCGIIDPTSSILPLLHSSWLNEDRAAFSRTQLKVEFVFDKYPSLEDFSCQIGRCGTLPFHASARYEPDGLWNQKKKLSATDLRDSWDDLLAFRYR